MAAALHPRRLPFVYEVDLPPLPEFRIPLSIAIDSELAVVTAASPGAVRLVESIGFRTFEARGPKDEAIALLERAAAAVAAATSVMAADAGLDSAVLWWRKRPEHVGSVATMRIGTSPQLTGDIWQELGANPLGLRSRPTELQNET